MFVVRKHQVMAFAESAIEREVNEISSLIDTTTFYKTEVSNLNLEHILCGKGY
jgi:hypothetical protein